MWYVRVRGGCKRWEYYGTTVIVTAFDLTMLSSATGYCRVSRSLETDTVYIPGLSRS